MWHSSIPARRWISTPTWRSTSGNRWHTFDARFNVPRIGRINIACGLDAVDCAFSTLYGAASLAWFSVWNYQVDPGIVSLGDPIDLDKRLDGTPEVRLS